MYVHLFVQLHRAYPPYSTVTVRPVQSPPFDRSPIDYDSTTATTPTTTAAIIHRRSRPSTTTHHSPPTYSGARQSFSTRTSQPNLHSCIYSAYPSLLLHIHWSVYIHRQTTITEPAFYVCVCVCPENGRAFYSTVDEYNGYTSPSLIPRMSCRRVTKKARTVHPQTPDSGLQTRDSILLSLLQTPYFSPANRKVSHFASTKAAPHPKPYTDRTVDTDWL